MSDTEEWTRKQSVVFIEGKRKYLFCTDLLGMKMLTPIIDKVMEKDLSYELIYLGKNQEMNDSLEGISGWLNRQKMGSYLYFSGPWEKLKKIKRIAESVGFSNDEAQYIGYGEQRIRVFCCRCHGITEKMGQDSSCVEEMDKMEMTCGQCGLQLSISDHYSSLKDAYLGYVAKL